MVQKLLNNPPKMFGAYIESISSSIGYGGQGGSCQMTLVEDPENGVTISLPETGTACYVQLGGFSYGGIFQRWTYKEDIGGKKYDVILESPAKILDGVQVILSTFEGTAFNEGEGYDKFNPSNNPNLTKQIKNVWNPFGHKENYAFGGRFGSANINSAGFLARELLDLLELIGRGESEFGDKIAFGESEYTIEFGELKEVPEYFRIAGQSSTINNIIAECAEILQYDYFAAIKVDAKEDGGGTIENPAIEIKTIKKDKQPVSGTVESLVESAKTSGILVSSNIGEELSDEVTNRVVVGGPASRYYTASISACYPIWGKIGAKSYVLGPNFVNVPVGYLPDSSVSVVLDELEGAGTPTAGLLSGSYSATVDELRMATAGFDTWAMFKTFQSFAAGTYFDDPWCASVDVDLFALQQVANGVAGPMTFASTSVETGQKMYNEELKEYTQKLFEKVQNVANNYYGKKFLVPLLAEPGGFYNNVRFIEEDIKEESSWEYANSAWVSNKPVSDIDFYDSGRLKTTAVYPISSRYDYSDLGSEYAGWRSGGFRQLFADGIATTKCSAPENQVFWLNYFQRPFIVMDVSAQVKDFDQYTTQEYGLTYFAKKFFNVDLPPQAYLSAGKQNTQITIPPNVTYPDIIGVPQVSSRYAWGPWYKTTSSKGKAEAVFDSALVPDSFGSVERMNQAGQDAAGAGVSTLDAKESGRVELAELPRFNIAERFNGGGPYITNMSISVGVGGINTSYEFNTWTPNFGKLSKYNADRISRIYKSTLDALSRFSQDNPKRPIQPRPFKTSGGGQKKSSRSEQNRTSAGFSMFSVLPNFRVEGDQINLADAAGFCFNSLLASFGCSEDQKWSPIGTRSAKGEDDSGIYFQLPVEISEESAGRFLDGVFPSCKDLDPYFSTLIQDAIEKVDFLAANNSSKGKSVDLQIKKANKKSIVDEIKTIGLRGPMMLSGFGIDIAGNPVPSDPDDITTINEDALNRNNWNTGPVNLMWDKERKIWSGGLEVLSGILTGDISAPSDPLNPTTFTVEVLRKTSDDKGAGALESSGEELTCYNRDPSLSQVAGTNVFVIVIRLNYEWTPLWVSCP